MAAVQVHGEGQSKDRAVSLRACSDKCHWLSIGGLWAS